MDGKMKMAKRGSAFVVLDGSGKVLARFDTEAKAKAYMMAKADKKDAAADRASPDRKRQAASVLELRDRLQPARVVALPRVPAVVEPEVEQAHAFLVENPESGSTFITVPVETASASDEYLLHLSGRLVEAGAANRNGAFWTVEDLTFGLPSVAAGPLNWLHEERKVVGAITRATLMNRETAGSTGEVGPHIRASSVLWRWLYPREARAVADAHQQKGAYYSMECVSRQVSCVGEHGCGATMDYLDALRRTEKACTHVRERSAVRRFVDPVFLGAAVIVPPVQPGWGQATIEVQRQAASVVETQHVLVPGMNTSDAERMVAQVLEYAGVATG